MAHQSVDGPYSLAAAADLRTHQHKMVVINSSGLIALAGVGVTPHGVLNNAPNTGEQARFYPLGKVLKFKAGTGGVTIGVRHGTDAAGAAILGATNAKCCIIALETAAAGEYFTGLYVPPGTLADAT